MSELAAKRRRLKIELVGAQEADGAVRLDAFHKFIQQLVQTLAAVESEIDHHQRPVTVYRVIGLSYASPAMLEIEAVPANPAAPDLGPQIIPRFAAYLDDVRRNVLPPGIEHRTLEGMQAIVASKDKYFQEMRFREEERIIEVDNETHDHVRRMLGNIYTSHGTIRGRLEVVNLHGNPCTAVIYPVIGAKKIRCVFRKPAFPNIGDFLDKAVDAQGVLKFLGDSRFPFEMELKELKALPAPRDLPPTEEILGSIPGITEGLSVVDYLRKRRDEEAA